MNGDKSLIYQLKVTLSAVKIKKSNHYNFHSFHIVPIMDKE